MNIVSVRKTQRLCMAALSFLAFSSALSAQTLVDFEAPCKYFKGTSEASNPVQNWRLPAFTDTTWITAATPLRHGAGSNGTVLTDMPGNYSCVYLRQAFTLVDASAVYPLTLTVNYDAGFVCWVNGIEVARGNAPAGIVFNGVAPDPHASGIAQPFAVPASCLVNGANMLAIQAFSHDAASFMINARLKADGDADTVATPQFSVPRGFYDTQFQLDMSTTTPGANIRYTFDGSPPSATVGTLYTGPLSVNSTQVIQAIAFKDGMSASATNTCSYIFLNDVITQSANGAAPPGWPSSWGSNAVDYGMDPDIVNSAAYGATIKDDLKTIPSLSVVMKLGDLFDAATGIYANARFSGRAWERPCSLEWIDPANDSAKGFQINCGIRIRGGVSRTNTNPKHAFRFFFRSDYGPSSLNYKLISDKPTTKFQCFDLRCSQNYTWSYNWPTANGDGITCLYMRDELNRDSQHALGQPNEGGDFFHLYINGQYWGLYNSCERPEADYGETYFGGDSTDYDVLKCILPNQPYYTGTTDGNAEAWTRLWNALNAGVSSDASYFKLQGKNPDGSLNPNFENLLDTDNMIDYMLIIFYGGNQDGPITGDAPGAFVNNFFTMRNRKGTMGFRFFIHDSELTYTDVNRDRTGTFNVGNTLNQANPQWFFQKCIANPEFKIKFADHVHKHMFNDGALTPQRSTARFNRRRAELDRTIVGESARWGDTRVGGGAPYNRDTNWVNACNTVLNNFLPGRTNVVINQFRTRGWLSSTVGPSFSQNGGDIQPGFSLIITNPNTSGTIYYTTDGTDPRRIGGNASPAAQSIVGANATVILQSTTTVRARILYNSNWSGIQENTFFGTQDFSKLKITEIMYHPADFHLANGAGTDLGYDADAVEFIELKNTGDQALNLSGVQFTAGISYTFPDGSILGPGQFKVLVVNAYQFVNKYPQLQPDGTYIGNLANSGERVTLSYGATTICSVKYGEDTPWPMLADGVGFSLVPLNPNPTDDLDKAAIWRFSSRIGGSPGSDDPAPATSSVLITEVLTNSELPDVDYIELYNAGPDDADVGGWFITDAPSTPKKFRIPDGTIIPAGEYLVFDEADFNAVPEAETSFLLDSHGDSVHLYSADAAENLTGYHHGFDFGGAEAGTPFGAYQISTGEFHYPPLLAQTDGDVNAGPKFGPVVIGEIMYQPSTGNDEFVELKNSSFQSVKLYDPAYPDSTWKLDGIDFKFPPSVEIPARGAIVLTSAEPAAFRQKYNIIPQVAIFQYSALLKDGGELLELKRPGPMEYDSNGMPNPLYILVDAVNYEDSSPWPSGATGTGFSIERVSILDYGNDPINWQRSPANGGSPGVRPAFVKASFASAEFSVIESAASATVTVALDIPCDETVSVHCSIIGGSASPTDYQAVSGEVVFEKGVVQQTFIVPLNANNTSDQDDRTIILTLTADDPQLLGSQITTTLTIIDDDDPPQLTATAGSASEIVGLCTITATLSSASLKPISVNYQTVTGSATGGPDFAVKSGTVTFAPGETNKNFNLTIYNDFDVDYDETFTVEFSNSVNLIPPLPVVTVTIDSEDHAPKVTISGTILRLATPVEGVQVFDGTRMALTDALGKYSIADVPNFQTYTITPFSADYSFDPPSHTVKLTGRPAAGIDFEATKINLPPVLTSGPSVAPNPAILGQPVTLTCVVLDDDPLAYSWSFGDTISTSGPNATVTHTYNAPGTYTATVEATDPGGLKVNRSITFDVREESAVIDQDNDGYVDGRERELGTNPNNLNSKPGGTADFDGDGMKDDIDTDDDDDLIFDSDEWAAGTNPYDAASATRLALTVLKVSGSLKPGGGKDAFTVSGTIVDVPAIPALLNEEIVVRVGGAGSAFILDSKGKGRSTNGTLALKLTPKLSKSGAFAGGTVAFTASAKNSSFADKWKDEGVNLNVTTVKGTITMLVDVRLRGSVYAGSKQCSYSAKAGKSAAFK